MPQLLKKCSKCQTLKPIDEFYTRKSKPVAKCKPCIWAKQKEWYGQTKPARKIALKRYSMTTSEYDSILGLQGGVCKLCGSQATVPYSNTNSTIRALSVDHDHGTGKIRGILCGNCNLGLGYFRDKIELLEKAIQYLSDFKGVSHD